MKWYGVRSFYRYGIERFGDVVYEERIVTFRAPDSDAAAAMAMAEADEYVDGEEHVKVLDLFQTFWMYDEPGDGAEVYSLMRVNDLPPEAYLRSFFDTGSERQARDDS